MAAALVDTVLWRRRRVLEHYQGKDLEFKEYEPLFPYAEKRIGNKKAYYVVCDTYVTLPMVPVLFISLLHSVRTTPRSATDTIFHSYS